MIGFIIGLFVGALIGVAIMCYCNAVSKGDENAKHYINENDDDNAD